SSGIWPRRRQKRRPCEIIFLPAPHRSLRRRNSPKALPSVLSCYLYLTAFRRCFHIETRRSFNKTARGIESRSGSAAAWEDWAVAPIAAAGADTFPKLL